MFHDVASELNHMLGVLAMRKIAVLHRLLQVVRYSLCEHVIHLSLVALESLVPFKLASCLLVC